MENKDYVVAFKETSLGRGCPLTSKDTTTGKESV